MSTDPPPSRTPSPVNGSSQPPSAVTSAVGSAVVRHRRHHEGTIYQRRYDGLWVAAISLGDGRRKSRYGRSEPEARRLLREMQREQGRRWMALRGIPPKPTLRPLARDNVVRAIAQGRAEGWTDEYLAAVVVASIAPRRLRHGVFGPCAYCGDWTANTVDHVVPLARGGADDPSNVVSCCEPCNHRKQARTPEQWRPDV